MPPRTARSSGTRADVLLLALAGAVSLLALVLPDDVRFPMAGGLRQSVAAPFVTLQSRASLTREAIVTHDSATLHGDSVAMKLMRVTSLESENARLRKLLGLAAELRWGFVPAEALRGRSAREDFSLTLTAGSNAGVQRYSPVVAAEGLVGMVQTVDPTMSLAITWSHPDFRVSAMTADGSAFGIVAAHLGSGAERYLLELRGVPFRTTLQRGTLVLSSGLGGTYPRGIPIGIVLGELESAEGWARTYLIRPAVLPPDIANVMVLTPPRVAAGVTNVWATAQALDSASRAVAAAADSVARSDSAMARANRRADSVAAAARTATPADSAARRAAAAAAPAPPARRDTTAPRPVPRRVTPPAVPARRDTTRDTTRDATRPAPRDTARPVTRDTARPRPDSIIPPEPQP